MRNKRLIGFVLILILFTISAYSEGEEGFDWDSLIGKIINSIILFGGLFYFLRKPIVQFFKQRSLEVKKGITKQKKDVKQASEEYSDIQKKYKKVDKEILDRKKEEDLKIKYAITNIKKDQREEITFIKKKMNGEIKEQKELMLSELRERIADQIIEKFTMDIKKELDISFQDRIIKKNIKVIGDRFED